MPYNTRAVDEFEQSRVGFESNSPKTKGSTTRNSEGAPESQAETDRVILSTDGSKTFQKLSFEEAEREEREMYLAMTPQQRLDLQAQLIMMHYGPNPPRLARVFEIIQSPNGDDQAYSGRVEP